MGRRSTPQGASEKSSRKGAAWETHFYSRREREHRSFRNSFIYKLCKTVTTSTFKTVKSSLLKSCQNSVDISFPLA